MKLTYDGFGLNDGDDLFKTRVATFNKSSTIDPDVAGPLLAAAPELLYQLQLVQAYFRTKGTEQWLGIDEVILKATGGSNE